MSVSDALGAAVDRAFADLAALEREPEPDAEVIDDADRFVEPWRAAHRLRGARQGSIRRAAAEGRLGRSYQDEVTGHWWVDWPACETWWTELRARRSERERAF